MGQAWNSITNSYATGNVNGGVNSYSIGGLVGNAYYSITNSYATGDVSGGTNSGWIGGLVGASYNSINNSYATGDVSGGVQIGGLVGCAQRSISNSYATGNVSSTGNWFGASLAGGLVGRIDKANNLSIELKNNASFGNVFAQTEAGTGSMVGGMVEHWNGTTLSDITLTNSVVNITAEKDAIGGTYYWQSSPAQLIVLDEPENMETWNSNITTFSSATTLQVGIYGNNSSQITTQTNIDFGLMKQLESLDVSKVSSLEFIDSFLEKLNNK